MYALLLIGKVSAKTEFGAKVEISVPALGRPKKDDTRDKKAEYIDLCDMNVVEGKFGENKRAYGLNRIYAKLKETSECVIRVY